MSSNMIDIIIGVIVGIVCIVIGFGTYYLYQRYKKEKQTERLKRDRDRDREAQLTSQRSKFTATIRGNLVRTYTYPIERDYIIYPDKELGKGGVGVVYVGERKDNNEYYAIKYVNKLAYEREVARLERELKLLKDVDHTNIVRVFSVYNLPEKMFFVMELCSGGHLGNLLSRQPQKRLDEEWARRLCLQLVSAVTHIHNKGICHRDIKLQNILMDHGNDSTAQLKLIDFGYGAKFVGNLPMRTKCGTPYTTAPEVLRECYDERCDVWSIGVVLYIMLSGRRPFETLEVAGGLKEAGRAAMIANILACRYHFNHSTFRTVSDEAKTFVQKLLLPDYRERMTSDEALEYPWLRNKGKQVEYNAKLMHISSSSRGSRAISNMKVSAWNTAKNLTMIPLVFSLTAAQTAEMRALFQSFDRDSSGSLSREEYTKAMAVLSPDLNSWDVNHLFDIIDIDNDGSISYTEFLAATLDPRGIDLEQLNEAFNLMDAGGKGYITFEDIQRMLNVETEESLALKAATQAANNNNNSIIPQPITPTSRKLFSSLSGKVQSPSSRRISTNTTAASNSLQGSQGLSMKGLNRIFRSEQLKSSGHFSNGPSRRHSKSDRDDNYNNNNTNSPSRRASKGEKEGLPGSGMGALLSPSRAAANAAAMLGFSFGFYDNDNNNNNNATDQPRTGRRYSKSVSSENGRVVARSSEIRVESVMEENDNSDDNREYISGWESPEPSDPQETLERRIRGMIKLYDVDNDGVISYDEFLWAMTGAGKILGTELPQNFVKNKRQSNKYSDINNLNMNDNTIVLTAPMSLRALHKKPSTSNNSFATVSNNSGKFALPSVDIVINTKVTSPRDYIPIPTLNDIPDENLHAISTIPESSEPAANISGVIGDMRSIRLNSQLISSPLLSPSNGKDSINHPLDLDTTANLPSYRKGGSAIEDMEAISNISKTNINTNPNTNHDKSSILNSANGSSRFNITSSVDKNTSVGILKSLSGLFGNSSNNNNNNNSNGIGIGNSGGSSKGSIKESSRGGGGGGLSGYGYVNNSSGGNGSGKGSNKGGHFGVRTSGKRNSILPFGKADSIVLEGGSMIIAMETNSVQDDPTDVSLMSKQPSWKGFLQAIDSKPDSSTNSFVGNLAGDHHRPAVNYVSGSIDELLNMTSMVDISSSTSIVTGKTPIASTMATMGSLSVSNSEKSKKDAPLSVIPKPYSQTLSTNSDQLKLRVHHNQSGSVKEMIIGNNKLDLSSAQYHVSSTIHTPNSYNSSDNNISITNQPGNPTIPSTQISRAAKNIISS